MCHVFLKLLVGVSCWVLFVDQFFRTVCASTSRCAILTLVQWALVQPPLLVSSVRFPFLLFGREWCRIVVHAPACHTKLREYMSPRFCTSPELIHAAMMHFQSEVLLLLAQLPPCNGWLFCLDRSRRYWRAWAPAVVLRDHVLPREAIPIAAGHFYCRHFASDHVRDISFVGRAATHARG